MMRSLTLTGLLLLAGLTGCASTPPAPPPEPPAAVAAPPAVQLSRLTVETRPPGATVRLEEMNLVIPDGGHMSVPAGHYHLTATRPGYRPVRARVVMDGIHDQTVHIDLGKGYGTLSLQVEPIAARLRIDGKPWDGRNSLELDAGTHRIEASLEGYFPLEQQVLVTPGKQARASLKLKKIPVGAPLHIITGTSEAEIRIDGHRRSLHGGRIELPFGQHTIEVIQPVNEFERLYARRTIQHELASARQLTVRPDQRQRLYQGQWLPADTARQKEQQRFLSERVEHPLLLTVELDTAAARALAEREDLAQALHALLRVGDGIRFQFGDIHLQIDKRHHQMTPEFRYRVAAFRAGRALPLPPVKPHPRRTASDRLRGKQAVLPRLAFAFHRARSPQPLLDLGQEQLGGKTLSVSRDRNDGELTLIAWSESPLTVQGYPFQRLGNLWLARAAPADTPLILTWQQPPRRLAVISDTPGFLQLPESPVLKKGEKRLLRVAPQGGIVSVRNWRLSPGSNTWRASTETGDDPLLAQLDLSAVEIGPHERSGRYRQIWILVQQRGTRRSQRQLSLTYRVSNEEKDPESTLFLRRTAD